MSVFHTSLALYLLSCFPPSFIAICNELGPGGAVEFCHALRPFQSNGLLSLHHLGLCHHRLQDAVPAQCRQPRRVLQQLHFGKRGHLNTNAYKHTLCFVSCKMFSNVSINITMASVI